MEESKTKIDDTELNIKPKRKGGPRPGSGRKRGKMLQSTLDRIAVEKQMKQRIMKSLTPLLNAQLNVAKGMTFMYKIVETGSGNQKKREHVLVMDPDEIKDVLDECDGNGVCNDEYYYMTTKAPDNKAIDSLIDRAFGKARQNVGLDGGEDGKAINFSLTELLNE